MDHNPGNKDFIIRETAVSAYKIPTEEPESDGTLQWDHTTLVLVSIKAANSTGIGYTYANAATARMIADELFPLVKEESAMDIPGLWAKMNRKVRNLGGTGIAMMAISAVDNALWDLKAKLLDLPLCDLLGKAKEEVEVYASGGFTTYDTRELTEKFLEWAEQGHQKYKMKIGRNWQQDLERMSAARFAIGNNQLFVDANGAYHPREALAMANEMQNFDVRWYEEPVTSDNLEGMHLVRENIPSGIRIAAGEYGFNLNYFQRMLSAGAVDVLQADATRCGGITGFIQAHTLARAYHLPFSAHCAPALHLHPSLALENMLNIEYFRDHVRIENMLFEGIQQPKEGKLKANLESPGMGLEFKYQDAEKYQVKI